jgi:hypothetical protein
MSRNSQPTIPQFTRAKKVLAALAASLAVCVAGHSIWVTEIGPYDWPKSIPVESNRIYSPGGFSMIVPEGWRSGAGPTYISAVSGSSEYWSTQLWVQKGVSEFSQPRPLPENARFQGMLAYQQQGISCESEGSRPFFSVEDLHKTRRCAIRDSRADVAATLSGCNSRVIGKIHRNSLVFLT